MVGITRAFLPADVRSVLGLLSGAHDKVLLFMIDFYQNVWKNDVKCVTASGHEMSQRITQL